MEHICVYIYIYMCQQCSFTYVMACHDAFVASPAQAGVSGSRVEMARKIFVGSLPSAVTEDLLRSEFDRFGRIDEVFIKDILAL